MSYLAVRAEDLGKRYRIGGEEKARYKTLRDTLTNAAAAPFRRLRSVLRNRSARTSDETIWALKDISFDVQRGDVLGIIGRNGAGKSTLLKILSRITRPTVGYVDVWGRVGSLLEVGTGFHPELTGRENIYLNGTILGMRRHEITRKFGEIVEFAEIARFVDTPVKHYSSGMYMRLAFAVAAHLEPEILVVDEVLAVGDVAFQKKCLGKMGEVAEEGRTILFVSHNMAAIKQLCRTGILLHEGRILKQGPIGEVIQEYIGGAALSASCVEIKPSDHTTGLNGIQVRRIELVNHVEGLFAVPWKQPIRLRIDMTVTKPIQHVNFGLGITTLEQLPILTVHSADVGDDLVSLTPGEHRIEVVLDNPMRIGMYNLLIGAHEGISKSSIFFIPNAVRLEVVTSTETVTPYFEYNTGIVNGESTWKVVR
jgi:lipopolysaccharide transport system ATP-binding protein